MPLHGLRVLVTGCAGLVGSWLCEELLGQGAFVIGLDRDFRAGSRIHDLAKQIDLITGDLEDFEFTLRAVNESEANFVFHFAAQTLVGIASRNPLSTFKSNIEGTWNILEACRLTSKPAKRLQGILVASSDKAYGDQVNLPYLEDTSCAGRFPYDVSKSCADLLARAYFHSYKLPVCVSRCGNIYGGGDLNWSRIVPGTIRSLYYGEPPIIRSDGKPTRDYIYVKDVARACIAIAKAMIDDGTICGEAFNISNDSPVSVVQLVNRITSICGRQDLAPVIQNEVSMEIQDQYLCSDKIRRTLGWTPNFDLDSGLKETVDWYYNHLGRTKKTVDTARYGN